MADTHDDLVITVSNQSAEIAHVRGTLEALSRIVELLVENLTKSGSLNALALHQQLQASVQDLPERDPRRSATQTVLAALAR